MQNKSFYLNTYINCILSANDSTYYVIYFLFYIIRVISSERCYFWKKVNNLYYRTHIMYNYHLRDILVKPAY